MRYLAALILFLALAPYAVLVASEASNSHSANLVRASQQSFSITDASQTGLDFSNNMTLATWVRFTTLPADSFAFAQKRASAGSNRSYFWAFDQSATDILFYSWTDGTTLGCNTTIVVDWTPSTATWYHVAVTKSGTTVKFYVNGSQQGADKTCGSSTVYNGAAPFAIGGNPDDGSDFLNGDIDSLMAFDTALTSGEISSLYTDTCNPPTTNLISWWQFNNNADDSDGTNDLTANNSPTYTSNVGYTCSGGGGATPAPQLFINNASLLINSGSLLIR